MDSLPFQHSPLPNQSARLLSFPRIDGLHHQKKSPSPPTIVGMRAGTEVGNSLSLHLFVPQFSSSFPILGMPIQARLNFDDGQR
jgi:hypothetical protein